MSESIVFHSDSAYLAFKDQIRQNIERKLHSRQHEEKTIPNLGHDSVINKTFSAIYHGISISSYTSTMHIIYSHHVC